MGLAYKHIAGKASDKYCNLYFSEHRNLRFYKLTQGFLRHLPIKSKVLSPALFKANFAVKML